MHQQYFTVLALTSLMLISSAEELHSLDLLRSIENLGSVDQSIDLEIITSKGFKHSVSSICEKVPPLLADVYIQNIINSFNNITTESQIKGSQLRKLLSQIRRDCVIPGVAVFIERLILAVENFQSIAITAVRYAWILQEDPTNLEALVGLNAYIDAYGEGLSHILLRALFGAQNTLVQTKYAPRSTSEACLSNQCISMIENEIIAISSQFQVFFTQYNTIILNYSQYLLILNGGTISNSHKDLYTRKGEEDVDIDPLIRILQRVEPFSSQAIRDIRPLANMVEKKCNLAGVAVFLERAIVRLRATIGTANVGIADALILEEDPTNLTALTDENLQLENLGVAFSGSIVRALFGAQITLIASKCCLEAKEQSRLATLINENIQSIAFPAEKLILTPSRDAFQRYLIELLSSRGEYLYGKRFCDNSLARVKRQIIRCDQTTPPTCEYLDGMVTDFTFLQTESERQLLPLQRFINILIRDCNVAGITVFMERFSTILNEMQNIVQAAKRYIDILRQDATNLEALVGINLYVDLVDENRIHLVVRTINGAQNTLSQIKYSQISCSRDKQCLSESAILLIEEKIITIRESFQIVIERLGSLNDYLGNYLFVINTGQTPPEPLPDVIINVTTTSIICKNTTKLEDSLQSIIDGFQLAIIYSEMDIASLQPLANDIKYDCTLAGVAVFVQREANTLRNMIKLAQMGIEYAEILKREPANLNSLVGLNLVIDSFNIAFSASFTRDLFGAQNTLIEGNCCISATQRTDISNRLYAQFFILDSQFSVMTASRDAFADYLVELVNVPIGNCVRS